MSVPFSNTTLRIPRGFGNLLEGLSREVLREQPHDIIGFAAIYFEDLLQKRTESGIDPADWAAQLEDRFYNNHIFKEKRTTIPENEPKSAPVKIDAAYQEKDESAVDQEEALEGLQKICLNKPTYFTSISQQTISMMLQDKEKLSKHSVLHGEDGRTSAAVKVPKKSPLEEKSQVLTGAAPEQGPSDDTDSKMIAVATADVLGKGPTTEITAAEESALGGTTPQVIAVAPEGSPLEKTDSQVISATSEQGELEVNAPEIITAAPEQGSLEETSSQRIAAPLEKESKEQTTGQKITTLAEDEEEKMQSSEEPHVDTRVNEEQAAVVIQSIYRGYSTRKKLKEDAPIPPEADGDLFTEACPGTDRIDYSSGEELAFTEEGNINFEEVTGMSHEESKNRIEVSGLHTRAKDDTAEINICAVELGSPMGKENMKIDANICRAELQSAMSKQNMATEKVGHDICGTELDQKDFVEATFGSTANVDICGTELGFVVRKDTGQGDHERNEIDIRPQDGDKVSEESVNHHEVSGVLNDSQDQANIDQECTEVTAEADMKVNANASPEENRSAEEGSNAVE